MKNIAYVLLLIAFIGFFTPELAIAQGTDPYGLRNDGRPGSESGCLKDVNLNLNVKMPEMERILQTLISKIDSANQSRNASAFESEGVENLLDGINNLDESCTCEKLREEKLSRVKKKSQMLSDEISRNGARTLSITDLNDIFSSVDSIDSGCDCSLKRQEAIINVKKQVSNL